MRRSHLVLLAFSAILSLGAIGCGSGEPEPTKESFAPRERPKEYNPGNAGAPAAAPPTGR